MTRETLDRKPPPPSERAEGAGKAKSAGPSRRGFLIGAGGLVAATGAVGLASRARAELTEDSAQQAAAPEPAPPTPSAPTPSAPTTEPFWGERQGGIVTPQQSHTYFLAFDLVTPKREDVVKLLRVWTDAAARMARGETAEPLGADDSLPAADSGEALALAAARLTITFGFGPGLFSKDGHDRYGLAAARPEALVDLPRFNGDQLVEGRSGGDLAVQACADDPQIAFHAARQLARLAYGVAEVRWAQAGYVSRPPGGGTPPNPISGGTPPNPTSGGMPASANSGGTPPHPVSGAAPHGAMDGGTPRNLMGFKDGTQTPQKLDEVVWVGEEDPAWIRGGSYLVVRRIRIALEHWDRMEVGFQEQVVGRHKYSGAPLGKKNETDALDLDAADKDGNPVIPDNAHVRLATAASNGGAQILRRGYSYNDGVNFTAERWPPWRQGMEYDAGLLFMAYQRDPRAGFIKIFETMAKLDAMNQFATHTGSGIFACPGGAAEGEFIGQKLFATA